jgi:hypothetical protein
MTIPVCLSCKKKDDAKKKVQKEAKDKLNEEANEESE